MPARSARASSAPNQFGYVAQLAEVTACTRRARGYLLPAAAAPGNPGENRVHPQTVGKLDRLGLRPREVALDGGSCPAQLPRPWPLSPTMTFISGRGRAQPWHTPPTPGPLPHRCEDRIRDLKRGYHLRRSRLKGDQEQRIWTSWAVLAYNLDTLAIQST